MAAENSEFESSNEQYLQEGEAGYDAFPEQEHIHTETGDEDLEGEDISVGSDSTSRTKMLSNGISTPSLSNQNSKSSIMIPKSEVLMKLDDVG